jgi:NAD(P)-dependent dehydrogenase (short-subunit alcohol dehydrogenase family)
MAAKLQDRVLLISGSTGIAAATARLAASEGAKVFIASRTEANCRALAEELRVQGRECGFHAAELSRAEEVEAAAARAIEQFGRIDALYNVAGISGRRFGDGPLHECTEEGWERTFEANVKSLFLLTRAVLRHMLEQPPRPNGLRGTILHMASVLGFSPDVEHFNTHAYATSKAAIIGLTKSMAAYYAPHKVRVNAIAPGLVRTPMSKRAQGDDGILKYMKIKQPLTGGIIEPEDVARASVFLLSDDAAAITGDVLVVDGGWQFNG